MKSSANTALLFVVATVVAIAHATGALAAPLRVVPPVPTHRSSVMVRWVAELLSERLAECSGVDIVSGGRAARVNTWAHDPALDLTDTERWRRLESLVAIDAMITVDKPEDASREKAPATDVQVRIFRAGGTTVLNAVIGESGGDTPKLVSEFLRRIGRELKLADADIATLGEIRIHDPAMFRLYYSTRTGGASGPVNPFASAFFLVNGLPAGKPHWASDAAILHVVAGYTEGVLYGRGSEKMAQVVAMARAPLLRLLGQGHDEEAFALLRLPRRDSAKPIVDDAEEVLLQIAAPLGLGGATAGDKPAAGSSRSGDLDELSGGSGKDNSRLPSAVDAPSDLVIRTGTDNYTHAQRVSALRMLGVLASPDALALLQRAARHAQPEVRIVAAEALAEFKGDAGLDALAQLNRDADETVAFTAAISLSRRGRAPEDFVRRATEKLRAAEPWRTRAAMALASDPTVNDRPLLERLASDPASSVRRAVARRRLDAANRRLADVMADADSAVILDAIHRIPSESLTSESDEFKLLLRLANDPDDAVARFARDTLLPRRPKDALSRARFDLAVEAPYLRRKAVAWLASSREPAARAELIASCANADSSTRVAALRALAAADPDVARDVLLKAILDANRLVRLHAAALLATNAVPAQAEAIKAATAKERDRAIILYLADALARAENKPAPPLQPPANRVTSESTIAMLSGPLQPLEGSGFRAQFKPSHGNHVRDDAISEFNKKAHDAGVAYLYNVLAPSEPGLALVDAAAQDAYWLYIEDQLDTEHLRYIDGVDFMNAGLHPDALWAEGWRFFCEETGTDPARVKGDKSKLNPYETRAWNVWALRRCVEGRNLVYDYVNLKLGKLHPGFQVCMAIPVFAGAPIADVKFDVALCRAEPGGRAAFNRIRISKTLWPDRPVFCIGESLEVKDLAIVKYDFKTPSAPMVGRDYRAYTEALTSWIAGANPGWSCVWVMRRVDWAEPDYSGFVVTPDDTLGDAPRLREAIDLAFVNTEPVIRQKDALAKVSTKSPSLAPVEKEAAMEELIDDTLSAGKPDPVAQRIARDKAQMLVGFKIYGKHVLDMARLFASLPPNRAKADALVIDEWRDAQRGDPSPAGVELLGYYDCLNDINDAARHELAPYRFIAVDDPATLTDATIEAVTRWLKNTPGVLYVHGDFTGDNARQASTPENFDGRLRNDWPWEKDVIVSESKIGTERSDKKPSPKITAADGKTIELREATVVRTFELAGKSATAMYAQNGSAVLAVWRRSDFKGAVVFDGICNGGEAYRSALRAVLTDLQTRDGVGVAPLPAGRHLRFVSDAWSAEAADDRSDAQKLAGVDMLTGERSPVVGGERNGAIVGRDFKGRFAAAGNGVSVLCDQPIRRFEKIEGGVILECDGLIQAASYTGDLAVAPNAAAALPAVKKEDRVRWMLLENSEGLASEAIGGGGSLSSTVYFIRSKRAVTLKTK